MTDITRALEGVRVIDLATPLAEATGRVLADLGAEVIKVEPPGGCESRFTPPCREGAEGDPEGSLFWQAYGFGKKSVVLDLELASDRSRFLEMLGAADILVESFRPGLMDSLGLGYESVHALHPALLYVSVTPFGQTGPHARQPATDLTLSAAGGLLNMQGEGDRPPVPVGFPETVHHGAVQAAADALMALYSRNRSGRGQHLDTSVQAAVVWSLMYVSNFAAFGQNPPGFGEERGERLLRQEVLPGLSLPVVESCKDGHVAMSLVIGAQGAFGFNAAMEWVGEQGGLDPDLVEVDWTTWIQQIQEGSLSVEAANRGVEQFLAHLRGMTKAEIHAQAVAQKWLVAPVNTAADLLDDPQLASRDYWVDWEGMKRPGPFARLSATPIVYERGAPRLGEHQDLLDATSRRALRDAPADGAARRQIFEGLKVADFSWIAAGPLITKDLANLGATVLRVETETRIDTLRFLPPWKGEPITRTGHTFANMNQSKLGIALNFGTDAGLEVAHRMAEWADVVVENFTPGTAERLGIDYESLREKNPGLVMLYTCMRGQTGPERAHTGFGLHGAALAGFVSVTGWPDRRPQPPWGAYTDFISPRYALAALAAALHHRDHSGEGQCIDLSQIEAAIHFLGPLILDHQQGRNVLEPAGLDSERGCPHGVFPARGRERYVAVEVRSAEEWHALCGMVPALAALGDAGLDDLAARRARKVELESLLAGWLAQRDPFEVAEALRESGVPAYVPLRATDLHDDPQLDARNFFVELDHEEIGPMRYDGAVTHFSDTPARPTWAGPTIGQHSFQVMRDILGYSEEEIAAIAAAGALT